MLHCNIQFFLGDGKGYLRPFLAVFLDFLNAAAVGAPLLPIALIRSPEPRLMRLRLA
jgi:hypothetical protein